MKTKATSPERKRPKVWSETQYANLIRYVPSGTFYARVRVCGKLIRKSLQTDKISVARLRLGDFVKDQRQAVLSSAPTDSVKSLAEEILKHSDSDYTTKPSTKKYRQECLQMLERAAPELFAMPADKVSQAACAEIAKRLADRYSATRFNGILTVLRALFDLAVKRGWCHQNPASPIKRARVSQKELKLPTSEQFESLLAYLDQHSPRGAFLVRFLTFSGCRIDEARHVKWSDVDFASERLTIRGNPIHRTKNSEIRTIPLFASTKALLESRVDRDPDAHIIQNHEVRRALRNACQAADIAPLSHHDFRHLFATRCIESGVDIPTVSRWLGHKDGGALAMRTYGHLRDEHSREQAKKVVF